MEVYYSEILKKFPQDIAKLIAAYSSVSLTILKANNMFAKPNDFVTCKFLLYTKNMPTTIKEKKKFYLHKRKIYLINPDQLPMFAKEKSIDTFIPIFIKKGYIREFSYLLSEKNDTFITNGPFDIDTHTSRLILQFMKEAGEKLPGYEYVLQSLNTQIIISLLRNISNTLSYHSDNEDNSDVRAVKHTIEYLRSQLTSDFSLDKLAASVNYSPYHLIRIFKKNTGKTPYAYLIDLKIKKAKELLATETYSINEISILCGFSNRTHFSTVFKRKVGVTPSFYRDNS